MKSAQFYKANAHCALLIWWCFTQVINLLNKLFNQIAAMHAGERHAFSSCESIGFLVATTDTNRHNSCMTKTLCLIFYHTYLKLTETNRICMPDAIMINETIYIFQQDLLPLVIILSLFYMGKLQ